MAPVQVTQSQEDALFRRMYPDIGIRSAPQPKRVKIEDAVRISRAKHAFEKGYEPNWTEEIFKVKTIQPGTRRRVYKLSDWLGEKIGGIFYPEEIQRVIRKPDKEFNIEKILQTRKRGRLTEHLIKWRGLPTKFNSWINSKDVKHK